MQLLGSQNDMATIRLAARSTSCGAIPSISLSFTLANVLPPETVTSKLSRETVRERAEDAPVKAASVTSRLDGTCT